MYHKDGVRPKGNHSAGMRNGKSVKIYKFSPPTDGLGPKALVYINNRIRMCVCLFVCSFDEHLLIGK